MSKFRWGTLSVYASRAEQNATIVCMKGAFEESQRFYPQGVRKLRQWLQQREAELVAGGFLEEER